MPGRVRQIERIRGLEKFVSMRETHTGELLEVCVFTKSSRPRVDRVEDGSYKVYVSSAPERGKANKELFTALARHLGVKKSEINIVRGEKSRNKLIRIES